MSPRLSRDGKTALDSIHSQMGRLLKALLGARHTRASHLTIQLSEAEAKAKAAEDKVAELEADLAHEKQKRREKEHRLAKLEALTRKQKSKSK